MGEGISERELGMGILDDELTPIALRASTCIEKDLLYAVEDRDKEPWKQIFLFFIILKMLYKLLGLCHQHGKLNKPVAKLEAMYESLP